jgi:hypothetical protein
MRDTGFNDLLRAKMAHQTPGRAHEPGIAVVPRPKALRPRRNPRLGERVVDAAP